MTDRITTKAGSRAYSGAEPRPEIKDPDLLREWEALKTPEDRADFLEALAALEDVKQEGTVSWEDLKAELGG